MQLINLVVNHGKGNPNHIERSIRLSRFMLAKSFGRVIKSGPMFSRSTFWAEQNFLSDLILQQNNNIHTVFSKSELQTVF